MRRVAIISDIHGNSVALRAVLADIAERGIEDVYCLGDLVGYGPDPNGVIDLVAGAGVPNVMGNYDEGVGLETGDCGCYYGTAAARSLGEASYAFTAATVTPDRKAFLRGLPRDMTVGVGGATAHLVHGSPRAINEYLLEDRDVRTFVRIAADEAATLGPGGLLVFGHTHQLWHREYGGLLFVAAGSVGRPKDADPRAMYTILAEAPGGPAAGAAEGVAAAVTVKPVRVPYDVEETARAVVAAGLPEALAEHFRAGT